MVEFMQLVFTRMSSESYRRRLRSLLLCLCDVFRTPVNSLMCRFFVFQCQVVEFHSFVFQCQVVEVPQFCVPMPNCRSSIVLCSSAKLQEFQSFVFNTKLQSSIVLYSNAKLQKFQSFVFQRSVVEVPQFRVPMLSRRSSQFCVLMLRCKAFIDCNNFFLFLVILLEKAIV